MRGNKAKTHPPSNAIGQRGCPQRHQHSRFHHDGKQDNSFKKTILLLHGNQQTGPLLLGRLDRLRKRLQKDLPHVELVPVDAPHHCCFDLDDNIDDDINNNNNSNNQEQVPNNASTLTESDSRLLLTWWHRVGNNYTGLEESLQTIQENCTDRTVVGLLGFSQGARLVHLLALLHTSQPDIWFPQLQFVILAAGYDAPLPMQMPDHLEGNPVSSSLLSLHIWGLNDPLIPPEQSMAVTRFYHSPQTMEHPGKHFIPSKVTDIDRYLEFIQTAISTGHLVVKTTTDPTTSEYDVSAAGLPSTLPLYVQNVTETTWLDNNNNNNDKNNTNHNNNHVPDDENKAWQQEEVQALQAIFPEELELCSSRRIDTNTNNEEQFDFPIIYHFRLLPSDEIDGSANDDNSWPPMPLTLQVQYPYNYPMSATPMFTLLHENTVFQFPSRQVERLMGTLRVTAMTELGMPSVLSSIYAAREFLDSTPMVEDAVEKNDVISKNADPTVSSNALHDDNEGFFPRARHPLVHPSTQEEIDRGNREGLEIAESLLRHLTDGREGMNSGYTTKGGGSFGTYTIGLVGKPSAGKSTFFNAATAFSRQRGQQQEGEGDASQWGGASMAAHPFTTIDPNIGYCLVPAPLGSCPEDDEPPHQACQYASTHGRDPSGRRFLPVLLKDVAGLVPG
jgi:predicted esterase